MGKFFGLDSPFFKVMTKVADFIILNFLVLVFSIPVVTIGPALTAMYYVALKEARGEEGYIWRDFWKSFKANFKQGFVIELIVAAIIAVLGLNIVTCYRWTYEGSMMGQILMFLNIGLAILAAASLIYLFPLLAQFRNTVKNTLFNSLLMAMKHLPQTIVMLIATGLLVYAIISYPVFIFLFIALIAYVQTYVLAKIFKQYMPKEEFIPDTYEVPEDVDDIWDRLAAGTADEKKEAEQEATDAADDSSGQETAGPAAADEQKEQGEE